MLSVPIPIRWAGWESDTLRLQQNGWQLSAREDRVNLSPNPKLQIAMKHPDHRVQAITAPLEVDYYAMMHSHFSVVDVVRSQGLYVERMAHDIVLHMYNQAPMDFHPIDALPQMDNEIKTVTLDDLKIFADAQLVRTEEVIVMPDSVPDLMTHILKLQDPKQRELRAKARREQILKDHDLRVAGPRQRFHAQIITID